MSNQVQAWLAAEQQAVLQQSQAAHAQLQQTQSELAQATAALQRTQAVENQLYQTQSELAQASSALAAREAIPLQTDESHESVLNELAVERSKNQNLDEQVASLQDTVYRLMQ